MAFCYNHILLSCSVVFIEAFSYSRWEQIQGPKSKEVCRVLKILKHFFLTKMSPLQFPNPLGLSYLCKRGDGKNTRSLEDGGHHGKINVWINRVKSHIESQRLRQACTHRSCKGLYQIKPYRWKQKWRQPPFLRQKQSPIDNPLQIKV